MQQALKIYIQNFNVNQHMRLSHKIFPLYLLFVTFLLSDCIYFLWCVIVLSSGNHDVSDPGLPAGEEAAEVFGVHCLLNEEVYLAAHAEHRPLLNTLQLLLQSE